MDQTQLAGGIGGVGHGGPPGGGGNGNNNNTGGGLVGSRDFVDSTSFSSSRLTPLSPNNEMSMLQEELQNGNYDMPDSVYNAILILHDIPWLNHLLKDALQN